MPEGNLTTPGSLFIVSAPSGAGKSTLVKRLVDTVQHLELSVSHTTRPPRPGEQDGIHYHFVEQERFQSMLERGAFLEHAEVFGHQYGTSAERVEQRLANGIDIVLEIDWQGARQARGHFPNAIGIFILPPSVDTLQQRLVGRAQDAPQVIERRMLGAREELRHWNEYQYLVVNDQLDTALQDLAAIVRAHRLRLDAQSLALARLLSELVA